MTDPNYIAYLMITDISGSMWNIKADAEGGIRQYVRDQAALPGKTTLSFVQFDTAHELVHDFAPLQDAFGYTLTPRGGTALLDAVGFAVTQFGERLAVMPEARRPGKVIVLITTDGKENSSHEYTRPQVKELLTQQQEKYGWAVSYIGANVDAFAEAGDMGIPVSAAMNYRASRVGTQSVYAGASRASLAFASGQSIGISYTDQERDAAADKGNTPA